MADAFHVFVDGPELETPEGLKRLADAIATHYGLGAADLLARLQRGRFRVKTNTDRATAETYASDLARLGARCTIEAATPENSQRTTPIPFPAVRPATPPAGTPAVPRPSTPPPMGGPGAAALAAAGPRASTPPPMGAARVSTPPPIGGAGTPSQPPPVGNNQIASGLSAAFSGDIPVADLGALGADSFALSSLDGVDDNSGGGGSIGPPPSGGIPASIGPAVEKPKPKAKAAASDKPVAAKPATPKDEPLDMFAPPEMQGEEFKVDIASDEAEFSARKRASTPPPMETVADPPARPSSQKIPTTPAARKSQPSLQVPNQPVIAAATSVPSKLGPLGDERVRFAAGVLLAVLLGFVPAHFVAKMKEESAAEQVDKKVIAAQQLAETPELYANLDRMRADQLDRKESENRNAAIIGFAIWALVGGGIAFAWFKKIPWDNMG